MKAMGRQDGFSLVEMLVVVLLAGIVMGMAIPSADRTSRDFRLKGDAQALANVVSLAKMRAASRFTRTRVRADLAASSFRLEVWTPANPAVKTVGSWVTDGNDIQLSTGVTFSLAGRTVAPPNTQAAIGQSSTCTSQISLDADNVANTACIVFNSRGIPVDEEGAPEGGNALYISDGITVYGTTITATPLVRQWSSLAVGAEWIRQ